MCSSDLRLVVAALNDMAFAVAEKPFCATKYVNAVGGGPVRSYESKAFPGSSDTGADVKVAGLVCPGDFSVGGAGKHGDGSFLMWDWPIGWHRFALESAKR